MIKTGGQLRPPVFCSYILPEGETGMAKTVIRPAAEEDIPAIIALYRQLDSAMVALQPEFFCEAPREVDEIRKAVRADDADFLLAEQDGTAVGFALVYYAGWTPAFSCVSRTSSSKTSVLAIVPPPIATSFDALEKS